MKALYFPTVPASTNPLALDVNNINGVPGTYGTLTNLVNTTADYFWSAWGCNSDTTACTVSNFTSMTITDGTTTYSAVVENFIGGRPPRPISR